MGRFFTSVQIRSNNSKEQFIKSFSNMMKKRGFVPCSEDEAVSSYILAFSESGKWVTLTCEDYSNNPKQAHDDAKQTAAEMKTSSFSMDVVDSDWTYIELYTGTDIHDTVIVGRSEFPDDDSPKGRRECWEQLSEIWNKNEVFVEDMIAAGIVDPTKVTRSALENAASVAEMVLTTESLVADLPEPPAAPAAGGDMGGMGGMDGMM